MDPIPIRGGDTIQDRFLELGLTIGDKTIGVRCWDDELASMLQSWCGVFRSEDRPNLWLEIELRDGRLPSEIQGLLSQLRVETEGVRFRSRPSLWEGAYLADERLLKFSSERGLFDPAIHPRCLNMLLSTAYNTVSEGRAGGTRSWYLVHGCGVAIGGQGYLFTGPSGAGKTTVARLAESRTVLNDEAVLVGAAGGTTWITGTPLLGGINRRSRERVPLQAILMLRHGADVSLRELERKESFRQLLPQIFDLTPILPSQEKRRGLLGERVDFCGGVLGSTPVFELRFRPDGSFWRSVEAL